MEATAASSEQAMLPVAEAMRDAAATATDHAAQVKDVVSDAVPRTLRAVSRVVYTSAYVVSYGVVFAAVFVAQTLPGENPIMHGLRDGGRAAKEALKTV